MTAPLLTGLQSSVTFLESVVNTTPQLLDASVTFTDADNDFSGGGSLTISGLLADDRISVMNQGTGIGQIGLSGTNVTYSGATIGTLSGGIGGTLTITFGLFASSAAIDALIQNLTFANVSDTPATARTLVLDVHDAAGEHFPVLPVIPTYAQLTGADDPFDGLALTGTNSPAFVDLDGDGDDDLVLGVNGGTLRYFRNDAGTFNERTGANNPFNGLVIGPNPEGSNNQPAPTFGDIDGDGDLDLVAGDIQGFLTTVRNDAGTFTKLVGAGNPFNGVDLGLSSTPSLVDLDGDGDMDLVAGDGDLLRTFRNSGGTFTELTGVDNPFNGVDAGSPVPTFVDLDGDGDMDAAVGGTGSNMRWFRNDGGSFTELTGAQNPFSTVYEGGASRPAFCDIDNDGDLDVVMGGYGTPLITNENTTPHGVEINVIVTPEGDAPKLTGLTTAVSFGENLVNATPQRLDAAVVFTDHNADLNGGKLTLSGLLPEDRASVLNQGSGAGQIGVSGANVSYGGVTFATMAGGVGAALTITFNASATVAAVDALIQNLSYANVNNLPNTSRTLHLDLVDGLGEAFAAHPVAASFEHVTGAANPFNETYKYESISPAFIDFDRDGDLDLVYGESTGVLMAFFNDAGSFARQALGNANPFYGIDVGDNASPSFGDIDGDGDIDAVVGNSLGTLRTFRNDAGAFTELTGAIGLFDTTNPLGAIDVGNLSRPSLGDIDGDDDVDLIVGSIFGVAHTFRNDGGHFTELTGADDPFHGASVPSVGPSPTLVDMDGDGDLDAVFGVYLFRNDAGSFTKQFDSPFHDAWLVEGSISSSDRPSFIDYDNDGDLDAVFGQAADISVLENTTPHWLPITVTVTRESDAPKISGLAGAVTFAENLVNATPQRLDTAVVFTDPNGDMSNGSLRLSGLQPDDHASVLNQGSGAGQIGLTGTNVTYGGVSFGTLAGGDGTTLTITFNDSATVAAVDALIQNLTYSYTSNAPTESRTLQLEVFDAAGLRMNAQAPSFSELNGAANPFSGASIGFYSAPSLGDIDGDGDPDAIVGLQDGTLLTFRNDGGSFTELTGSTNPFNGKDVGDWSTPAIGDIDGDGDNDVVVGEKDGYFNTYRNDGGSFVELSGPFNPLAGVPVDLATAPALFDFDADGDMDLVAGLANGGYLHTWRNDGGSFTELTGSADPFADVHVGDGIHSTFSKASFIDIDADDDVDVVVGQLDGILSVFRNDSSSTQYHFTELTGAANPFNGWNVDELSAPSFGDIDGDGDMDLLEGTSAGGILAFENTTPIGAAITVTVTAQTDTTTGGAGNDSLVGTSGSDVMFGLAGNDTLDSGLGLDTLTGGTENDTYIVQNSADVIVEAAGNGTADQVLASVGFALAADDDIEILKATSAADTGAINLTGNALAQTISGNAGVNVLIGAGGDDTLNGLAGNDTLNGGAGNDVFYVGSAGDVIVETAGNGTADQVLTSVSFTLAGDDDVEVLKTTSAAGTAAINLTGNALAQTISGNAGANAINGGAGNDTLTGLAGNDTLNGGAGDDMLTGGTGNDVYTVDSAADVIVESAGNGTDQVQASVSITLAGDDDIEILKTTSAAGATAINLTGNALAQAITGNAGANMLIGAGGNDTLDGLGGNDTLNGGAGNDVFTVDSAADVIVESAGNGTADQVLASVSFTLAADDDIEILGTTSAAGTAAINLSGNALAQTITGNAGANLILGNAGNDTLNSLQGDDSLNGGAGDDVLTGGAGNDVYTVDSAADVIVESAGNGTDQVQASVSITLAGDDDIEILKTTSAAGATAINLTGNALAQAITGNAGANMLIGAGGNDTLDGLGGNDTLNGGAGNDVFTVDSAADVIVESAGNGTADQVLASVSFTLAADDDIEILGTTSAAGTAAINLSGNALAQTITGNAGANLILGNAGNDTLNSLQGDDSLNGGAGDDVLTGGAGNDVYTVDSAADVIVESAGNGTDQVQASASFTLAADDDIEVLATTSAAATAAINLTGNALAQTITGNAGANALSGNAGNDAINGLAGNDTLDGGIGNDTLDGGAGNDVYIVDSATDVILETAGNGTADQVRTSLSFALAADDNIEVLATTFAAGFAPINLTGNAIAQHITGNAGANDLNGRAGNDTLEGGLGADQFIFSTAPGASNVDTIQDYSEADDTIVLDKSVFTAFSTAGTLSFAAYTVNTTGLAEDSSDRIIYQIDTGKLYYDADGAGGAAAVQFATVAANLDTLGNGEFLIV